MFAAMLALTAMAGLLIWSAGRVLRPKASGPKQATLFFLAAGLAMLVLHWPQIRWAHEIQVDESQMLAQGMRFYSHPIPWRDVDGMTNGPLDSMILCVPMFFGIRASWEMARVLLCLLNFLTVVFICRALRKFGTAAEAQLGTMPAILFYALATHPDFVHYSSETLSALLLAAGLYLLAAEWRAERSSGMRWFLLGMLGGAIPFAKLQAGPIGLFLVMVGAMQWLCRFLREDKTQKNKWRGLAALVAGMVVVPGVILGVVAVCGAFGDFWISYIRASITYTGQEPALTKELNLERVLFATADFKSYLYCVAAALAVLPLAWLGRKRKAGSALFWPMIVMMADCVLTLFCLIAAGKDYYHYAVLLVPGTAVLFGLTFLAGKTMLTTGAEPDGRAGVMAAAWSGVFFLLIGGLLGWKILIYKDNFVEFRDSLARRGPARMSLVGEKVLEAARPGDTMSVWGWMAVYHVETQIPPAARLAIGACLISPSPYQEYFKRGYLADLEKSRPAVFIDAIAGNTFEWYWTNPGAHESFPELARFVDDNYSLWLSIHMTNQTAVGAPVRIYVLKERMAELRLTPADLRTAADPSYLPP